MLNAFEALIDSTKSEECVLDEAITNYNQLGVHVHFLNSYVNQLRQAKVYSGADEFALLAVRISKLADIARDQIRALVKSELCEDSPEEILKLIIRVYCETTKTSPEAVFDYRFKHVASVALEAISWKYSFEVTPTYFNYKGMWQINNNTKVWFVTKHFVGADVDSLVKEIKELMD